MSALIIGRYGLTLAKRFNNIPVGAPPFFYQPTWGNMKSAQSLETLGQNTWILTPVIFIVVAVLGLNFLGDGLRDAADPYSNL